MSAAQVIVQCSLSDKELVDKVENMVIAMYANLNIPGAPNGVKIPCLEVPANADNDFDFLIFELTKRFRPFANE